MAFTGTNVGGIYVDVVINTGKFNTQLAGVRSNLEKTAKGWATNLTGLNRAISKIAAPILALSKMYMAAFIGGSTKALMALSKMHSVEGEAWKRQIDVFKSQFNYELARIGAILLKSPIFGRTVPQWMNQIIAWLRRLDLSKVQLMVKWFERAAIIWASFKSIKIGLGVAAGITALVAKLASIAKTLGITNIVGGAMSGLGGVAANMGGAAAGAAGGTLSHKMRIDQALEEAFERSKLSDKDWAGKAGRAERTAARRAAGAGAGGAAGTAGAGAIANLGALAGAAMLVVAAFTAMTGFFAGLGMDLKGPMDALRRAISRVTLGFEMLVTGNFAGFKAAAQILTGEFRKAANTMTAWYKDMSIKEGNRQVPLLKGGEEGLNVYTGAEMRNQLKDQIKSMGKSSGSGKYMAASEAVKNAQETQKMDQELITWQEILAASLKNYDELKKIADAATQARR